MLKLFWPHDVFLNDAYRGGYVLMLKLILGRLFLNDAYRGGLTMLIYRGSEYTKHREARMFQTYQQGPNVCWKISVDREF